MTKIHYSVDELLNRPTLSGIDDRTQIYFHFRPARPANLLVTKDPLSGEVNVSAGTYGVVRSRPLTIVLHIAKKSFDSIRNAGRVGTPCVVALPSRHVVFETWGAALPIPRGIGETEITPLTLISSTTVDVPSIEECPVNLECTVARMKDNFSHVALFLEVVAASADEEFLEPERQNAIKVAPTYEVDDQLNEWGGSIERLGVNGELAECPGFPAGPKMPNSDLDAWLLQLKEAQRISGQEYSALREKLRLWCEGGTDAAARKSLHAEVILALQYMFWDEWDDLRNLIQCWSIEGQKSGEADA